MQLLGDIPDGNAWIMLIAGRASTFAPIRQGLFRLVCSQTQPLALLRNCTHCRTCNVHWCGNLRQQSCSTKPQGVHCHCGHVGSRMFEMHAAAIWSMLNAAMLVWCLELRLDLAQSLCTCLVHVVAMRLHCMRQASQRASTTGISLYFLLQRQLGTVPVIYSLWL